MIYTNKYNLPFPVYRALIHDDYVKGNADYSVTELNNSPRSVFLMRRHVEEVEVDVMDNLWRMRGQAMHSIVQKADVKGAIIEKRGYFEIAGCTIAFKPDYVWPVNDIMLDEGYEILDWKDTSLYAIKQGPKPEWTIQLNAYAYGMREQGLRIVSLRIIAILRDWSWTDANLRQIQDYPQTPLVQLPINLSPSEEIYNHLKSRVILFKDCANLPDAELPECTSDERYATPDMYAVVFAEGASKGKAVPKGAKFKTHEEAQTFLTQKAQKKGARAMRIEYRKGRSIKCERYCPVNKFCNQYHKMSAIDPF